MHRAPATNLLWARIVAECITLEREPPRRPRLPPIGVEIFELPDAPLLHRGCVGFHDGRQARNMFSAIEFSVSVISRFHGGAVTLDESNEWHDCFGVKARFDPRITL